MVAYKNLLLVYAALALTTYKQKKQKTKNKNRQLTLMTQYRKKAVLRIALPLAYIQKKTHQNGRTGVLDFDAFDDMMS